MIQQDEPIQRAFQKFEALGADYVRTKLEMGAYEDAELGLAEQWLASQSGSPETLLEGAPSGGKLKWLMLMVLLVAGGFYAAMELGFVKLPQKLPFALPF